LIGAPGAIYPRMALIFPLRHLLGGESYPPQVFRVR
jgi:hypothetical protein